MLKFLIIFLSWIVPGILLFLYLLWISKRFGRTLDELHAPTAPPTASHDADADLFANDGLQAKHRDAAR